MKTIKNRAIVEIIKINRIIKRPIFGARLFHNAVLVAMSLMIVKVLVLMCRFNKTGFVQGGYCYDNSSEK
jgi:hypothetical protein